MTNAHLRPRPFRRPLAAAVAAVTIAASAPFIAPAAARADTPRPHRESVHPAPAGKIPALIGVAAARSPRVQGISST